MITTAGGFTRRRERVFREPGEQDGDAQRLARGDTVGDDTMVSGGVPFDMVVTKNTRIELGNRTITLQDVQQDTKSRRFSAVCPRTPGRCRQDDTATRLRESTAPLRSRLCNVPAL